MAQIEVVRDIKNEESEEKVESTDVPSYIAELASMDWKDDRLFRFNLISNLVGLRFALENLVVEFQKAPVQRVMQMQVTPEMQMQAFKALGMKPPGRAS